MGLQPGAETAVVATDEGAVSIPLAEIMDSDDVRVFTVIEDDSISFALATMEGKVIAVPILSIEVR
jgi:hypothetical protein